MKVTPNGHKALSTKFRMPDFKMFKAMGKPNQHIVNFLSRCWPITNGPLPPKIHFTRVICVITRGCRLYLVYQLAKSNP